jgi:SAM-dependent methyltransferase
MHASSMNMMRELRSCIPAGSRVLDVGGADVNGSYRPLFTDCSYTSLDFHGADINVSGYAWPLEDVSFDAVISGQALEHDGMFWLTVKNMARVLKTGGHLILIVPSAGAIHRYPVDVYRFMPDAMAALAEWSGLELIGKRWDTESKWRDLGGVFRKPA